MKTFFDQARKEEGSVLLIALLILALLTLIGISATTTSEIELQISGNQKIHKMVFYAAEAGIEVGRAVLNDLKAADSGSWDTLLSGTQSLDDVIGAENRKVGEAPFEASFTLAVEDNGDLDGNTLVDTDNTIYLTSTGSYGNAQVEIETIVCYTGGGDQYAQEHYDTDSSGTAAGEGTAVAQNERW